MILLVDALNAVLSIILNQITANASKSLVHVLHFGILLAIGNVLHAKPIPFSQLKVGQDVQDAYGYRESIITNE